MEYIVVIDSETPYGRWLLSAAGQPGGAIDAAKCGPVAHPVILVKDIDWVTMRPFVRMTHLRTHQAADKTPADLIVPGSTILFATQWLPPKESEKAPADPPQTPAVH